MGTLEVQRPPMPSSIDDRSSPAGLRAVATFEALKGIVVLLLGIVLLFVHQHADDIIENLLYHLHMDPDRRFAQMLLNAADKLADARWWSILGAALTYPAVRFIEAWGLWHRRVWAEWFALLSGAMYLPWEILRMAERPTWDRVGVFLINLLIVLYMLWIRVRCLRKPSELLTDRP
jgi:uncharacterized membrane protein (DUF2068 family)